MRYDPRPGGPDGPPRPTLGQVLQVVVGGLVVAVPVALVLTAMVWAIVWLIANFPA